MSARSPRSSLSGASSSEVAQDFEDSLKDLAANNKYEIQNLTLIAKESTEHAQAISQVLENHIKTTQPQRKLPALYVLDSIIKNVGTPYTVYLGRNLYSTFMEAYSLVDGNTRKALEAMLKTWKEPVFGSMDTRPVFPPDLVRPIENALIKIKTIALQHQRQLPQDQYRSTPTPPQVNGRFQPPGGMIQQPPYGYAGQQSTPQPSLTQSLLQPGFQPTPVQQPSHQSYVMSATQASQDLEGIRRELAILIFNTEQDISRDVYNVNLQGKLKALQDLRTILYTQQIGPAQLGVIADQIRRMGPPAQAQPQPTPPVISTPQWQPPVPSPFPIQHLPSQASLPFTQSPSIQHMPSQPPPSIPQSQLNSLAALFSAVQKPSTPQLRAAVPSLQNAPHAQVNAIQNQASATSAGNGTDLLAALTKAGLMKPATTAQAATPIPATAPPSGGLAPTDLAALLGSLSKNTPQAMTIQSPAHNISLTNKASLAMFRPDLVKKLYTNQSNQCPQCGRRFASDAHGSTKKKLHLDWHFRINQRLAESARGHHRNWFINEIDWIGLTEFDVSTATADAIDNASQAALAAKKKQTKGPEEQWVRAPAGVTRTTCSICCEEMRSSHPEELQDWVFMNAAMNNGKIVHATCLAEMQQGTQGVAVPSFSATVTGSASLAAALAALGATKREGSRTPDSSLGKRKAEGEVGGGGKVLRES